MLVVRLEIWPGGDAKLARPYGTLLITNDGTGTEEVGNYTAIASHTGPFLGVRPEPYKSAQVKGFRRRQSPYRLICRVLRAMGET